MYNFNVNNDVLPESCDEEERVCGKSCRGFDASDIRWDRIFYAALAGGILSGLACFVYDNVLSDNDKKSVYDLASEKIKGALKSFANSYLD